MSGGGADGHVGGASADGWGLTGKQAQREHIFLPHFLYIPFLIIHYLIVNCCGTMFSFG